MPTLAIINAKTNLIQIFLPNRPSSLRGLSIFCINYHPQKCIIQKTVHVHLWAKYRSIVSLLAVQTCAFVGHITQVERGHTFTLSLIHHLAHKYPVR